MSVFGFINDYIQKQKLPDQQSLRQQLQHIHRQDQQLLLQSPEAHGGHLAAALLRPEQQLLQNDLERKSHDSLGIAGGIGLGLGGLARMPKRRGNDGAPSSSDLASAGLVLSNDLSVRKEYVPQPSVLPSIEPSLANPNKFRKINISAYDKPNDAPRGKITACSICLWNPDHILRTSVCEVLHTNANDKGRPKHGSLMDLRMGPVDSLFKCMTCGSPSTSCMGHFGHITLAMPVYHISYMKTILYLLQCFCHGCSTFLMSPSDARFDKIMALPPIKRGREFAKIITESVLTCPNAKCGLPQRVYMQQKAAIHCYLRNPKPVRRTKKDMIAAPVLGASVSKKKNGKTSLKKSAAGVVGGRQDDSYVPAIGAGKTASESKRSAVVAMDESSSSSSGEESSSDGDGEDGEIDDGYVAHRHATDDDDDDEEEEDENENEDDLDKSDSDDTDTDQRSKKRERHHDVDSDASSSDDDDDDDDDRGDNKSYAGRDRDKLRAGRRDKEQDSESDSDEYRLRDMQQEEEDEEAEADLNDDVHDEEDMDYVEAAGGGEDPEDLQDEAEEDDDGDKEDGEEKDGGGDHDRDEDDEDVDGRIRGLRKLMMGSDGIYADGGHFGDTADDDIKTKRGAAGVAGRGASSSYDRSAQLVSAKFIRAQTKKRCGESVPFTPNCALGILRHIAPTDYDKVGFTAGSTRPHYTIIQHLPVPPPCVRVMIGTNQMGKTRIEYDAGRHLKSVITCNNQLRSKKMTLEEAAAGAVTKTPDELTKIRSYTRQEYDKLQKLIAQHIDKDATGAGQTVGRGKPNIQSILSRLAGKTGRFRGGMGSKRVGECARSVISGGVKQRVNQIGVPVAILMVNVKREVVNDLNRLELQSAVNRGPDNWPGASTIIDLQGNVIDLRHARNRRKRLKNGMTVLRHTVNGDLVLYGRQPSLQKWSLIGAEVYAVFGNTFRIHMNGTPSQNADCDGDEESIYFPQTVDADAEIRSFMCAPNLILNSKASAYFGAVQDQLVGAYVCSDRSIFHSRAQVMTAAAEMQETRVMQTPQPAIMMRDPETGAWREMWTGKQVASLPFPNASIDQDARAKVSTWRPSVNYESADVASMPWTNLYEQVLTDKLVCVRDGQLHCGRLNQSVIGCARAGVVQNMVHDFGEATTLRYLSDSQRMFCSWIANHGFGLGLSDAQTKKETHDEIGLLKTRVLEYLTKEYKHSSPAVAEKFTGMVLDRLLNATSVMVTKPQLGVVNYMLDVISSGAKGKKANIGQTSAMVGQIVVGEQRLPMGYNGVRCSPHWPANSPDPRSRGACISSFLDGLNMYEYFAHAMGTREGLVDTASKTAEVGYAIRKFMRAMEDLMVEQDGSVRDPNSGIVCFRYGGDGFDVSRLESQQYPLMQVTKRADLDRTFADPSLVRLASVGGFDKLLKEEVDALERDILLWRRVKARQHSNFRTTAVTGEVKVAVHLDRILKNAERAVGVHGGRVVHPLQVMRDRNELLMRCRRHARVPIDAVDDTNHGYFSFESMVRAYLATASIVQRLRLSKAGWDSVVQEAEIRFVRSLVHPGDMVGCLAGHSIGEPAQQMTLNTFHLAGTGASNMTAGLPRIKELIRVASNCLNPHMAVHLLDSSPDAVNQALRQFSPLHLRDILKTHESGLFYDPDAFAVQVLPAEEKKGGKSKRRSGKGTGAAAKSVRAAKAPKVKERVDLESKSCIQQDRALVESLLPFLQAKHVRDRSRFVIRLAIDKDKLMAESNGKLTIDHIYWKFCAVFKDSHLVFKSSPNAREWVIRIHAKIKSSDFRKLERQALSKRDGMAASTSAAVPATSSLQSTSLPNLDPSTAASDKSQPIAAEATSASSSGLGLDRQLAEIRTVQQMANMIGDIRLRGVDNIKSAYVSGSKNANGQTIIETVGSNLQQVLTMSNVDKTQTTTNMLDQIARAFGVKAAAAATVKEYQSLYQANASDVERHHLYTLAAQMSKTGELVGLNRNQYHQDDRLGWLKQCTFERIVPTIMESAQQGRVDELDNTVSSYLMSARPRFGTQFAHVVPLSQTQCRPKSLQGAEPFVNPRAHRRVMRPISAMELMQLVPLHSKRAAFVSRLAMGDAIAGSPEAACVSKSQSASFMRQSIDRKNRQLVMPDYADLLPPPALLPSALAASVAAATEKIKAKAKAKTRAKSTKKAAAAAAAAAATSAGAVSTQDKQTATISSFWIRLAQRGMQHDKSSNGNQQSSLPAATPAPDTARKRTMVFDARAFRKLARTAPCVFATPTDKMWEHLPWQPAFTVFGQHTMHHDLFVSGISRLRETAVKRKRETMESQSVGSSSLALDDRPHKLARSALAPLNVVQRLRDKTNASNSRVSNDDFNRFILSFLHKGKKENAREQESDHEEDSADDKDDDEDDEAEGSDAAISDASDNDADDAAQSESAESDDDADSDTVTSDREVQDEEEIQDDDENTAGDANDQRHQEDSFSADSDDEEVTYVPR